jgi:RHS repeat-associated protein
MKYTWGLGSRCLHTGLSCTGTVPHNASCCGKRQTPTRRSPDVSNNIQRSPSAYGNRFMFQGREWIPELGVYDYRHRMYQPALGLFLQMDPMGLQTEGAKLSAEQKALFSPGGSAPEAFSSFEMNLYRYCELRWRGSLIRVHSRDSRANSS